MPENDSPFLRCSLVSILASIHPNPQNLVDGNDFNGWAEEVRKANESGQQRPYSIAWALAGWPPFNAVSDKGNNPAIKLEGQDLASLLPADADCAVIAGFEAQMKILASQMRSKDTAFARFQLMAEHGIQGQ